MRYNSWTILERYGWQSLCRCDCGTEKLVAHKPIINGKSKGCRECAGKRQTGSGNKNWRGYKDIPSSYWTNVKWNANGREISIQVTIEEAWDAFTGKCAISGLPISFSDKTASLDRIDSNKPYVLGNIQWVHKDINRMKNDINQQRFIELCKAVAATAICEV